MTMNYHSLEHIAKLYQYLFIPCYQSGWKPTPGMLPAITGWPIFFVHFWLNPIVWVALVGLVWHLGWSTVPWWQPGRNLRQASAHREH